MYYVQNYTWKKIHTKGIQSYYIYRKRRSKAFSQKRNKKFPEMSMCTCLKMSKMT